MSHSASTSSASFAFCPSLPDTEGSDRKALSRYLTVHGYKPVRSKKTNDGTPDLLVIAPPPGAKSSAPCLEPDDLRVFQELLGGLVLYVDPTLTETNRCAQTAMVEPSELPPIFVFGSRNCDEIPRLSNWLSGTRSGRREIRTADPEAALNLAINNLGVKDGEHLLQEASGLFNDLSLPGNGEPPWWDVLYALKQIAASYDVDEHDINRYARHSFSQGPEDLAKLHKKRDMLNIADDLWKSLKATSVFRKSNFSIGQPSRILLVDDNPEGIRREIVGIVRSLMPKFELWCWNPRQSENIFDYLCAYNSMRGKKTPLGDKAERWYPNNGNNQELDKIISTSRFVLVDLLFRIKDEEREYGAELIRGLRRYCLDNANQADDGSRSIPSFLAFSRSDDLEKIQKALRAGASGYVLKNRVLSLPAELARLRAGGGQNGLSLHRNFHALDFLPNETRGLLHKVRLPRVRFDRPEHKGEDANKETTSAQRMAALLRAIPKPDLHLHVGSCMTPEFIVVASLVMLAERHVEQANKLQMTQGFGDRKNGLTPLLAAIPPLFAFWSGKATLSTCFSGETMYKFDLNNAKKTNCDPVDTLGKMIRNDVKNVLSMSAVPDATSGLSTLRSILHSRLNIRDHWTIARTCEELDAKDAVTLMLFAISTGEIVVRKNNEAISLEGIDPKDIMRLFILFMATNYTEFTILFPRHRIPSVGNHLAILANSPNNTQSLTAFGKALEKIHHIAEKWSSALYEGTTYEPHDELILDVRLTDIAADLLRQCPSLSESPLEFLIASGTRSHNLSGYLAGCEYSGAEHLQRPCLMRLYARQTLEYLVRHGVLYAELRSAISGYASKGHLTNQEACTIFSRSFIEEQKALMDGYSEAQSLGTEAVPPNAKRRWLWCSGQPGGRDHWIRLFKPLTTSRDPLERHFPAKVNLIFTGKRHKATREMLMEAAAGVLLSSDSNDKSITASEFVRENMINCRVVGFDLAGLEESFPPEMFRSHFEQLSRMHIPITAHAGENASARFVESAVLDLRARRLGHGLALADDEKLMARIREESICIELCPVSNYQTNEFSGTKPGREYPLKKFLKFGNIVCLNTDNPIVSYTNIVKEFFHASYAYGEPGLSLWDALRMVRMGFVHSFKGLAERRALIEMVEQMVFDLLIDPGVEELLRAQA